MRRLIALIVVGIVVFLLEDRFEAWLGARWTIAAMGGVGAVTFPLVQELMNLLFGRLTDDA